MTNIEKKICENSSCKEVFLSKNPKKRFCCLSCKNKAAYRHKITHYGWEVEMAKARLGNIQIAERLQNLNREKISEKELLNMGFVAEALYVPFLHKNKNLVFRIGNVGMILKSSEEIFIIKL